MIAFVACMWLSYKKISNMWRKTQMLRSVLCCALAMVVCAGCINIHAEENALADKPERKKAAATTAPMLRHVVLFRFKNDTSPEKITEIEKDFAALPSKIKIIHAFEWGTDVSVESRSDGFTHCFVVTFLSEADRDAYIIHPAHKEFAGSLGGSLDKVLVIDYWTR